MPEKPESKTIAQLMAEADELLTHMNSDFVKDMEETHRSVFETHVQKLQKIKSEVQKKSEEKGEWEISASADGMHEAIQDIVKAMQDFKNKIF